MISDALLFVQVLGERLRRQRRAIIELVAYTLMICALEALFIVAVLLYGAVGR